MADGLGSKISVLPEAEALDDSDLIYVVSGGASKKMTVGNAKTEFGGGGGGGSSQTIADVLWSGSATPSTTGTDITLSHAISDYDFIVFTVNQSGSAYDSVVVIAVNELTVGESYIETGYGGSQMDVFFDYTSDTTINIKSSASAYLTTYTKITGLKFCGTLAPMIYSTEEREVGVWVDNKPLYQKSYINVAGTGASVNVTLSDLSDIETIFIVPQGSNSTDAIPFPYVHYNSANLIGGFFTIRNGVPTLAIRRGSDMAGVGLKFLTVCYTKTTDVAGSGSYGSLGIPMEHLSGDVHAVGTDERGKTIYEVTLNQDTFPLLASTGTSRALGLPAELGINGSVDRIWMASPTIIKANEWMTEFPYVHYDVTNDVGGFFELINNNYAFCVRTGDSSSNMTFECLTIRFTKRTE